VILIRGVVLLFLSPEAVVGLFDIFRSGELFYIYAGITLVLGLYLTHAGFSRRVSIKPLSPWEFGDAAFPRATALTRINTALRRLMSGLSEAPPEHSNVRRNRAVRPLVNPER